MGKITVLAFLAGFNVAFIVAEVIRGSDPKCGFTTFVVGLTVSGVFNELYRTCYDSANVATQYTQHVVYPYTGTVSGTASWRTSGTITGITGEQAASFNNDNIRARTHAGFPQYDRGHLAANADFSTTEKRSTTYEIINAVPQVHTLNNGGWKRIENFIRENSTAQGTDVVTGGLGVLEYNSKPIYLWGTTGNRIPEFTYKVASMWNGNTATLYAFVAYNSEDPVDYLRLQAICQEVVCPITGLTPSVVCCDPAQFIRSNIPTFIQFFNV